MLLAIITYFNISCLALSRFVLLYLTLFHDVKYVLFVIVSLIPEFQFWRLCVFRIDLCSCIVDTYAAEPWYLGTSLYIRLPCISY